MNGTTEQPVGSTNAVRGYRLKLQMVRVWQDPYCEEQLGLWSSVEVPAAADGAMPAPVARIYNDTLNRLSDQLINVRQALTS